MKSLSQHISQVKTLHSLNNFIKEAFNFRINRDSAKNTYSYSPKTTDELKQIIQDHYDNNIYNLNDIDVSHITDFSKIFLDDENTGNPEFDVSKWDVSNGKIFEYMFNKCYNFNCDLSRWNVSSGINFKFMFSGCNNFNSDLSNWNVSNGKEFEFMFDRCNKFNADLSQWDVSNGKVFTNMFDGCKNFNSNLSQWDVSNGIVFTNMFYGCKKFNYDLSQWDVSKGVYFSDMFTDCTIKQEFKPKHEKIK